MNDNVLFTMLKIQHAVRKNDKKKGIPMTIKIFLQMENSGTKTKNVESPFGAYRPPCFFQNLNHTCVNLPAFFIVFLPSKCLCHAH